MDWQIIIVGIIVLLAILFAFLTWKKNNAFANSVLNGLDGLLFFFAGFIGCVILFMMTATDHSMARENYNLLWAWPVHLIFSFFITSARKWVKIYLAVTAVVYILLAACWFFIPQDLNENLLIILSIIIFRSVYRFLHHPGR